MRASSEVETTKAGVKERWTATKNALLEAQAEDVGFQFNTKKPWLNDEILEIMQQRREHTIKDKHKYKGLNRFVRRKYKKAR